MYTCVPAGIEVHETDDVGSQCGICYDNAYNIDFINCECVNHLCSSCYQHLPKNECPFCRAEIDGFKII